MSSPPGGDALNRALDAAHELTRPTGPAALEFVEESDAALCATRSAPARPSACATRIPASRPDAGPARRRRERRTSLADARARRMGRIELLHYLREQSLCVDYHRYGNGAFASMAWSERPRRPSESARSTSASPMPSWSVRSAWRKPNQLPTGSRSQ